LGERSGVAFILLLDILRRTRGEELLVRPRRPPPERPVSAELAPPPPEEAVRAGPRAGAGALPDYYSTLGIAEGAQMDEIRKAYRELIKKYHPDVFAGEGMSKQERAGITRKAQDINEAWMVLSGKKNKKDYDDLRKGQPPEAAEPAPPVTPKGPPRLPPVPPQRPAKTPSPKEVTSIGIQITPTKDASLGSVSAAALTTPFRNTVAFGIERLNAESPEQAAGLFLYSQGIKSERLAEKVNASGVLTGKEKESLLRSAETMRTLEETYPQRSRFIFSAFREPEIQIAEYTPAPPSGVQQISFQRDPSGPVLSSENFSLGPVGSFVQQRVGGFAEKQVNKVVDKAGKKVAEKVAKKAAGAAVQKAVETGAKAAAGTAVKAGAEGIAVALGLPAGGVGAVITWLLIKAAELLLSLLKKILRPLLDWLRENKEAVLAALVGAGAFLGSPVLIGIGVAGFGILGISAVSATITAAVTAFYLWVTGFFIPRALAYIIFVFLAFTLLTIFILFIINSGSYVVPLGPYPYEIPYLQESLYIRVEKTAGPTRVDNPPPGRTIAYSVTITAKQGALTNISFSDVCRVLGAGGSSNCPAVTIPPPPTSISPTSPYTFSYQRSYGSQYRDSVATDTFTVTADAPGAPGEISTGTSSVIIGDPPTSCFEFEPANAPYSAEFQAAAIELSSHTAYAAKLCAAGTITVRLNTSGPVTTGACAGASANSMFFNNCLYFQTHGQAFITYLFAHESGHTYDHRTSDLSRFISQGVMSEGGLPTYCIAQPPPPNEDFADTIGDYVDNGRLRHLCAHNDQRPFSLCNSQFVRHCDFARNVIFNE